MSQPNTPRPSETGSVSSARRREVLRGLGQTSVAAGLAAPVAAFAGSARSWCRSPVDQTKSVQASISGMGSILLSAQANAEVLSKKVSYYASKPNWSGTCSGRSGAITCDTPFKKAFGCGRGAVDSQTRPLSDTKNCLLNKTLLDLCTNYSSTPEAHWACALGNANKLAVPVTGAKFPYTPLQVTSYYLSGDLALKSSAYTFFSQYCEQYA